MNEAVTSKPTLRETVLARRDGLAAADRAAASLAIAARALPILAAFRPRRLAGYVAMRSECDPRPILDAARADGAAIGLPVIAPGATLRFLRHDADRPLVAGGFGTLVPPADAPPIAPDFIIVPVVGFDRGGTRLGYGKGHYDRAIAAIRETGRRPPLLGVAFSVQEIGAIPREPHDIRLDWIVTENETLDFRGGGV